MLFKRVIPIRFITWSNSVDERISRMILFFLIPVNMMFGVLPKEALLQQFHFTLVFRFIYLLSSMRRLSKAIRCGNLRDYTLLLHDYEAILIQRGLYVLLITLSDLS